MVIIEDSKGQHYFLNVVQTKIKYLCYTSHRLCEQHTPESFAHHTSPAWSEGSRPPVASNICREATTRLRQKRKIAICCCRCFITPEQKRNTLHVPSLFGEVFEHHVLHVAIAETAEKTRHNRALRNSSTLPVCSGNTKHDFRLFMWIMLQAYCAHLVDYFHLRHNFSKILE